MECYLYELPTTGSISFAEICLDHIHKYAANLMVATTSRASLRTALKENKRVDGVKDYLKLVKISDDYLPHLYSIIRTIEAGEIALKAKPVFSWRSTLSSTNVFHPSRIPVVGLTAELAFSLLVYAFALSNLARSTVISLGDYEHDRHILDSERRMKDEKLSVAVNHLCRASGVFLHVAETVLPQWELENTKPSTAIPELNKDVIMSLSNLALSDAQNLAIRKLMSKSAYDSLISAGPPLPKSHPSPALIAKLYLHVASCFSSARSLSMSFKGEVSTDIQKYLINESAFALALAHKWLGVDAGESGSRGGDAVAFLKWAKEELEELQNRGKKISVGKARDNQKPKRSRVADEVENVAAFLTNYRKINDSVHFQPVPPTQALQPLIPAGRSAVAAKPFAPPRPIFGPGSLADAQQLVAGVPPDSYLQGSPSYAGAGSYF